MGTPMNNTLKGILSLFIYCCAFISHADEYTDGVYELNRGNFIQAIALFEPLAEENYPPALYQLATIYLDYGPRKDIKKGLELMHKAADKHYTDAVFYLALSYTAGDIVQQDLTKAFTLTKKAAYDKLVSAEYNLAVMYSQGQGTPVDYTQAVRWYKKAANKGYVLAQFNLALMYYDGKGVKQSYYWSYIWNTIAAKNGYKDAETSRLLDQRILTPDEIKSGRREANALYKKIQQAL